MLIYKTVLVVAASIVVLFEVLEALFRWRWLPLGGSQIAQLGILFGLGFVVCEIAAVLLNLG